VPGILILKKFSDRDLYFFYLIPDPLHICIIRSIHHLEARPRA
jgi:hypothetical protein